MRIRKTFVVTFSLLTMLGLGVWSLLGRECADPDDLASEFRQESEQTELNELELARRRDGTPQIGVAPFQPDIRTDPLYPPHAGPWISGTFAINSMDGPSVTSHPGAIMSVRSYITGESYRLFAALPHDEAVAGEVVWGPESIAIPLKYRCPVSETGLYQVSVRFAGVFNSAEWYQEANSRHLVVTSQIVDKVTIRLSGHPAVPAIKSVTAIANLSFDREVRDAQQLSTNTWTLQGPLILPIGVRIIFSHPELPQYSIRIADAEHLIQIGTPHLLAVTLVDSNSGGPVPFARVTCEVSQAPGDYSVAAVSDADGLVNLLLPDSPHVARSAVVSVSAEGFWRARKQIAGLSSNKLTMRLVPGSGPGGRLTLLNGRPAANARVYIPSLNGVVMWGVTDGVGRFSLNAGLNLFSSQGSIDPPTEIAGIPLSLFVREGGFGGLISDVRWEELVRANWQGVIDHQEISVTIVAAQSGSPLTGAELRLIPRLGLTAFRHFALDPVVFDSKLVQAKFQVIERSNWWASVRLSNSKNWIELPLNVDESGAALVRVDTDRTVKVRVRDHEGNPVAGVRLYLRSRFGGSLEATTGQDGRAEFVVPPANKFRLDVDGAQWTSLNKSAIEVEADPKEYEVTVARKSRLKILLNAADFGCPAKALVVYLGKVDSDQIGSMWWTERDPVLYINEGIQRVIVLAPGCEPVAREIRHDLSPGEAVLQITLQRGATVQVARTVLPAEYKGPLKGTAKAVHLAPEQLGAFGTRDFATALFSSEFAPVGGNLLFGPFTPGIYQLKLIDGTGAILWEDTATIEQR